MSSDQPQMESATSGVKVSLQKLTSVLGLPKDAKKQLRRINKNQKVLEPDLPPVEQARIRRKIAYDGAVKQVDPWDAVIKENRKTKVIYPEGSAGPIKLQAPIAKISKPKTPMEEEVAKLLRANQEFIPDKKILSQAEERALKAKSLEEARMRRAELMRQKVLCSYYNAKMRRQNKIKSKSYRRIVRKTKEANQTKLMDDLRNKNPEAYREWMKREEQKRIEERMTLKHRGTSKAMARRAKYAKYDEGCRAAVQDMTDKHKELTRKTFVEELADDDAESDNECYPSVEVTSRKRTLEDMDDSDDEHNDEQFGREEEVNFEQEPQQEEVEENTKQKQTKKNKDKNPKKKKVEELRVDPTAFMSVETELGSKGGAFENMVQENDFDAHRTQQRLTIAEAFADDDVIQEFQQSKKEIAERDQPKDIDLSLPGWGEWAGPGLKMSKKKKRRFTFKAPELPRKDRELPLVILSEAKDMAITKHQVSSLPHPWKNVPEYIRKFKKPIGKDWNTEAKYRELIKPTTVTRLGSVIKPINPDAARQMKRKF